jgi:hypothetical protein
MAEDYDRAATFKVLAEITAERDRQVDQHGHDPKKDDRQPMAWWGWLLARRATDLSCPIAEFVGDSPRRQLLEIAAIAVAALESLDRRELADAGPHPPDESATESVIAPATLTGCTCGFTALLPSEHRGGCPYSGYPEVVDCHGRRYLNPHWLTVTEDSELVVDDRGEGELPIIVASYTPAGEDGNDGKLDAYGYQSGERPWSPFVAGPLVHHRFCLWHGTWVNDPAHGDAGPSCQTTEVAPPWADAGPNPKGT